MTMALVPDTEIAVVGAGAMGAGIAHVAAAAGHTVLLFDQKEGAAIAGIADIRKRLERAVEKARISEVDKDQTLSRLVPAGTLASLASADLVIEAIIEDLGIKKKLFAALEDIVADTAILATNTSSFSITELAADLKNSGRVVGMHFFNPAPVMKLVEVVSGLQTSAKVTETVFETAIRWGKKPVNTKSTPGFIVNRVARPYYYEAFRALEEGAAPPQVIDCALKSGGGFRMGPLELTDLIGQDVNSAVSRSIFEAYSHQVRFAPSLLQEELVAAGKLGRKTGHLIYSQDECVPFASETGLEPSNIIVSAALGAAESLVTLLELNDCAFTIDESLQEGVIVCGEIFLALTDGQTATARSAALGRPVVLFDYAADYSKSKHVFLAPADQASAEDILMAVGFFQNLGKAAVLIDDHPGMLVMRTIASLSNVAADAARDKVASPSDIDTAMIYGVNYPDGPLEWAKRVGIKSISQTLRNLAETTGEAKYRPSSYLLRQAAREMTLAN